MRRNIILLTGAAGSGKTTIAKYLVEHHHYTRVRFAEPIKAMMAALGLTEREIDGDLKEVPCWTLGGTTPRVAQQTLGTEWGRNLIHPTLWTRGWLRSVGSLPSSVINVVADDCRFPNEIDAARQIGRTIVVRLMREGAGLKTFHPTEHQHLPFDFIYPNNSSVEEAATIINARALGRRNVVA